MDTTILNNSKENELNFDTESQILLKVQCNPIVSVSIFYLHVINFPTVVFPSPCIADFRNNEVNIIKS